MRNYLLIALTLLSFNVLAAGGPSVPLDKMDVNLKDKASLQRGAQLFTNYCMGCHSAQYSRYERVADDLGIPHELYEQNMIFTGDKIGQLMKIGMSAEDAAQWFGAPPPDLTLTARLRGPDWLYTYLRSFYSDESKPWGVNNTVFKDVGMPNVLAELQGIQVKGCKQVPVGGKDPLSGLPLTEEQCDQLKVLEGTGSMTEAEFDGAIYDLVNFLAYMGEPSKLQSHRIGIYVLIFIVIFGIFAYLLNREYWKDIH